MDIVFKIFELSDWAVAQKLGKFEGSADDQRDGYIHLSAANQLAGTLQKHFSHKGDVILVAFDTQSLGESLKWEVSRNGGLFPHLYTALDISKSLWSKKLATDEFGIPKTPDEFS